MSDYFSVRAVNNSLLKHINPFQGGSPTKFKQAYDGLLDEDKHPSLDNGRIVHKRFLEPGIFKVADVAKPSEMMETYVRTLVDLELHGDDEQKDSRFEIAYKQSGYKISEKQVRGSFEKDYKPYYDFLHLQQDEDIICIDSTTEKILDNCMQGMQSNPEAHQLILGYGLEQEIFTEQEIYFTIRIAGREIKVKAKLDRIIIDHTTKTITVPDLKTTSKPVVHFPKDYAYYHYYRQQEFYLHAVVSWLGAKYSDYKIEMPIVAVCTKSPEARVFIPEGWSVIAATELTSLLARYVWHEVADDWINPVEEFMNRWIHPLRTPEMNYLSSEETMMHSAVLNYIEKHI